MRDSSHDMSEMEIRQRCGELLQKAQEEATRLKHGYIGTEHIFNALTRNPSGITNLILTESGLDPREVRNSIRKEVGGGDDEETRVPILTPRARHVLAESIYLADDVGSILVEEEHVLLAMLQEGEGVPIRKLKQMGVAIQRWVEYLMRFLDIEGKSDDSSNEKDLFGDLMDHRDFGDLMEPDNERVPGRAMPTPLLDKYGRDLTEQARLGKLGPAVGRDTEIRAVARTLTRSKKNNPLLVGDAGVGKTAIIEGLAW